MAVIASILGVLIALIGVVGLARPRSLIKLVQHWHSPARFWTAIVVRVVFGVALLAVAPECRLPSLIRAIGVISILAAVAILIMGRARLDCFVGWWLGRADLVRLSAVVAIAFGVLLVYGGA